MVEKSATFPLCLQTMTNLSPAARAIVDVFDIEYYRKAKKRHDALAAVLRAAADCLTDATSAHTLYAISDELEDIKYGTYRCPLGQR